MKKVEGLTHSFHLKALRRKYNLTQGQLAEQIGTTNFNISHWENGRTQPGLYYRQKLCAFFEIQSEELGLEENNYQLTDAEVFKDYIPQSVTMPLASPPLQSPESQHWYVPYRRNPFFTGRDQILNSIYDNLHNTPTATGLNTLALSGLCGIGKTQIALEYTYHYRSHYAAVLWCHAASCKDIYNDFVKIAELLQANQTDQGNPVDCVCIHYVKQWLSEHTDWLLIFDGVENVNLINEFLPLDITGHILCTTRTAYTGMLASRIEIEGLSSEDGASFLLTRAKYLSPHIAFDDLPDQLRLDSLRIVDCLNGLPLALNLAGAHIEETQCSLAEFYDLFQTYPTHLLCEPDTYADYPYSLVTMFVQIANIVREKDDLAAEFLTVCCCFASAEIPEELFLLDIPAFGPLLGQLAHNPLGLHKTLKDLLHYSLIQRQKQRKTLCLHSLLQVILHQLLPVEIQQAWNERLLTVLNQVFQTNGCLQQMESWNQMLLPHISHCLKLQKQWGQITCTTSLLQSKLEQYQQHHTKQILPPTLPQFVHNIPYSSTQ